MILTAYIYTTAIIFLVGVQADELIRKDATRGEQGLLGRVGAALGWAGLAKRTLCRRAALLTPMRRPQSRR